MASAAYWTIRLWYENNKVVNSDLEINYLVIWFVYISMKIGSMIGLVFVP